MPYTTWSVPAEHDDAMDKVFMPQDMFALHAAKASSREETSVVPPPPPVSSEIAAPRLPPDRQPEAKLLENQWPQLAQLPVLKAPVEEAQVRSGDIVFSVNGVIGKATELMRVLKP